MRHMPQSHLYICAYGCLRAWLVFSTVSRSMLVAAAVIATPLCSLPPPSTLLPLPDTPPQSAWLSAPHSQRAQRIGQERGRLAGFSYRGGGDTTEPGPFFRGVWLLSAGTMSEDNHSHYRLDPSDRLSGLGQRKKRPKKVKVKALRELWGGCLAAPSRRSGGGAGGAGVCGGVIVEGDGSIYQ